jgi:hypothetical protein
MDLRQLLALLQHILVWIPPNNPIRTEIQQHITNIKNQLAQQQ